MGDHRHALADPQDERRRPRGVAHLDPGTHQQPMAKRKARRNRALELQGLNGLDLPHTKGSEPALDQFTANSRMMAFSRTRPLSVAAIRLPEFKISPKLLKFATLVVSSGLPAIAS